MRTTAALSLSAGLILSCFSPGKLPGQCSKDTECAAGSRCYTGVCVSWPDAGSLDGGEADASTGPADSGSTGDAGSADAGGCTDLNCGGTCPDKCQTGKTCRENSDCVLNICNAITHKCGANACDNGLKDPSESDIDCGGTTCNPCDADLHCTGDTDCVSNRCSDTFCQLANFGPSSAGTPLPTDYPTNPTLAGQADHGAVQAGPYLWIFGGESYKDSYGQAGSTGHTEVLDFSQPEASRAWTGAQSPGVRDPGRGALGPDGNLYVFGGFAGNDPTVATWERTPNPPFTGTSFAAAQSMPALREAYDLAMGPDQRIYLFGDIAQIDSFSPTDGWRQDGQISPVRTSPAVATGSDGKIYIMGGQMSGWVDTNQAFDTTTKTLESKSAVPVARAGYRAVAAPDGRIYLLCGGTTDVYAFTPATNTWVTAQSLTTARKACSATIAPTGQIVVVGGYAVDGTHDYVAATELLGPSISLSTATASRGSTVKVSGQKFASFTPVRIYWGAPADGHLLATTTAAGSGYFTDSPVVIPDSGDGPITVIDLKTKYPVTAPLTIQ